MGLTYDDINEDQAMATVVVAVAKAVAPTLPDPVGQLLRAVAKGPNEASTEEDARLTEEFYRWCQTTPCAEVHDTLGTLHVLGTALRKLFENLENYGLASHLLHHLRADSRNDDNDTTSGPPASPGSN